MLQAMNLGVLMDQIWQILHLLPETSELTVLSAQNPLALFLPSEYSFDLSNFSAMSTS